MFELIVNILVFSIICAIAVTVFLVILSWFVWFLFKVLDYLGPKKWL